MRHLFFLAILIIVSKQVLTSQSFLGGYDKKAITYNIEYNGNNLKGKININGVEYAYFGEKDNSAMFYTSTPINTLLLKGKNEISIEIKELIYVKDSNFTFNLIVNKYSGSKTKKLLSYSLPLDIKLPFKSVFSFNADNPPKSGFKKITEFPLNRFYSLVGNYKNMSGESILEGIKLDSITKVNGYINLNLSQFSKKGINEILFDIKHDSDDASFEFKVYEYLLNQYPETGKVIYSHKYADTMIPKVDFKSNLKFKIDLSKSIGCSVWDIGETIELNKSDIDSLKNLIKRMNYVIQNKDAKKFIELSNFTISEEAKLRGDDVSIVTKETLESFKMIFKFFKKEELPNIDTDKINFYLRGNGKFVGASLIDSSRETLFAKINGKFVIVK